MNQTLEYLKSIALMVLIFMGLTGAAYHMFREGGWIESATGGLWNLTLRSPLMAVTVIASAIFLGFMWRQTRRVQRQEAKAGTMVFYLVAAAGAYFMGHLAFRGTL